MFQKDRALDVLARIQIESLNNRWDQSTWGRLFAPLNVQPIDDRGHLLIDKDGLVLGTATCNTAGCFAGWAAMLDRADTQWAENNTVTQGNEVMTEYTLTEVDGKSVWRWGAEHFGIEPPSDSYLRGDGPEEDELWDYGEDMPALFRASNSIGDLYDIVLAHIQRDDPDYTRELLDADVQQRAAEQQRASVAARHNTAVSN